MQARPGEVGRGPAGEGREEERRVLDRAAERTERVETRTERHDAAQRDRAMRGLEADKVVPGGGDADRAAGVRADARGGEAEGDGGRGAGGRAARRQLGIVDVGRRRGHRVDAEAGEGELGHVGLPEADGAGTAPQGDDRIAGRSERIPVTIRP